VFLMSTEALDHTLFCMVNERPFCVCHGSTDVRNRFREVSPSLLEKKA